MGAGGNGNNQWEWEGNGNKTRCSAIAERPRSQFDPKFQVEGVAPTKHFCTISNANECLKTLPLTVVTQRNFVADFLQAKCNFYEIGRFAFLRTPLGDLGLTYDDDLRLIRKRVVDFLLVLTELFSLGVTGEALRANID